MHQHALLVNNLLPEINSYKLSVIFCVILVDSVTKQLTLKGVERRGSKARKEKLLALCLPVYRMEDRLTWVHFVYDLS